MELEEEKLKIVYTIKRARETKNPTEYSDLDSMLEALREVLKNREKSGFLGKIWLTIEAREDKS